LKKKKEGKAFAMTLSFQQNVSFLVCTVANVKGTTYADARRDLEAIIARSVDARRNALHVPRHVKMELVKRITRVSVILVGLESYVTKISHGLRD